MKIERAYVRLSVLKRSTMETFMAYLEKKKIDSESFKKGQPSVWEEWSKLFPQLHEDSFTSQKLFLINKIRRAYPLKLTTFTEKKSVKRARPVFKR